jgi:four helix bundle protein
MAKPNVIAEKSEEFAVRVINLSKYLIAEKKEYIISKQIFRSGTSIGANVSESRNAQSKDDFISKLNIALKEADETAYWLRILKRTEFISQDQFSSLNEDVQELISILVSTTVH